MHYLLTGGSGFIGRELCLKLTAAGHTVTVLTRDAYAARRVLLPRIHLVESLDSVGEVDAIVNLAGENLAAGRWTPTRKVALVASRTVETRRVLAWIARQASRPKVLVSGSAIGWYGKADDRVLDESAGGGGDFAARLCRDWEAEADKAADHGVRVCRVRTGIVLSRAGGALARMTPLFRLGLGGPIGDGGQWMSWIHRVDIVALIIWLVENPSLHGAWNGTAPNPVTNAEFAAALGATLHRPARLRMPAFLLRAALGEMADLVTSGQRVIPARAAAAGFRFQFDDLRAALAAEFT
ncbi:MAG: TIGR01777 family oxidoreductase [Rudaea sp.]